MRKVNIAVIGTGWIGELRARTCAQDARVGNLYLVDPKTERAEQLAGTYRARRWARDHEEILDEAIDAVIISAAPETLHYPIARQWLWSGRHVLLEKPMALRLHEADELVDLARQKGVKLTIGYTQRYNPKFAYAKQCIEDGTLGKPVTAMISRHVTRSLGAKIAGRGDLGPAQMEATHDVDLMCWWMAPARPVRVYAQAVDGVMKAEYGLPDSVWGIVTMDDGTAFTFGANWNLPLESPGFAGATVELICSEGAMFIDDTHKDTILTTMKSGAQRVLATMPGQPTRHVYQGPMEAETRAFLDYVCDDQPVLVTPEEALVVMEVTIAADMSAERGVPISLPLPRD